MTTTPKPRRWFQFSLRTLLVLMLVACIGMSWVALKMRQARRQRLAVIAILLEGGNVQQWSQEFAPLPQGTAVPTQDSVVSPEPISHTEWSIGSKPPSYAKESRAHAWLRRWLGDDFFSHPVCVTIHTDAAMENLKWLPRLTTLSLQHGQITDAGLQHVKGLTQLRHLFLQHTPITDAGVDHLRRLTQLEYLDLSETPVTDAGVDHLRRLTQLVYLNLSGTRVTDACLEHLKGLSHLSSLTLTGTQVTDAGLEHLKGLMQLQGLALGNTQVTDAGLEHLKGLSKLSSLTLTGTRVTDAGLEHLKGLSQLMSLTLTGTRVTDAGLEHLKGLTQLQELRIENTQVSGSGIAMLRQALPKCDCITDSPEAGVDRPGDGLVRRALRVLLSLSRIGPLQSQSGGRTEFLDRRDQLPAGTQLRKPGGSESPGLRVGHGPHAPPARAEDGSDSRPSLRARTPLPGSTLPASPRAVLPL